MVLLAKLVAEDTPAQYPKSAGIPASSLPPSLLVYPHPPTRLHQRSLHRRVGGLQPVAQGGVLRLGEPVGSVSLQRRQLAYLRREVAGRVTDYVLRGLWSHL